MYLKQFEHLVKQIEKNDFLELIEFRYNSPVKKSIIAEYENELNVSIAKDIKVFFLEINGIEFQWSLQEEIQEELFGNISEEFDDYLLEIEEDEENPFAKINILPFEEIFLSDCFFDLGGYNKSESVKFKGKKTYTVDLLKRFLPFDMFSSFTCASFYLQKNKCSKVLLLNEHYDDWNNSRFTSFSTYLDLVLKTGGISEARGRYLNYSDGHLEKPILKKWSKKIIPKLFK